jgi:hypothetical protein
MGYAGAPRSKSAPWRWAAAIVFSLSVNSLVVGFFWELRLEPVHDTTPVAVVQLVRRLTLPRVSSQRHRAARSAPLAVRPSSAQVATPGTPPLVVPSGPTVAPPAGASVANLSRALRGLFGCDLAHLTDAERAACAERSAANRPATPRPLNLDPLGRYASNPEPYLTRMPKNGCKVRAAGDEALPGKQGVAAGVSCAWSF